MNAKKPVKSNPVYCSLLIFTVAQILILLVTSRIDPFLDEKNIYVPSQPPETISWWPGEVTLPSGEVIEVPAHSSLGPVLIYFLVAAAVLGLTLSFIPLKALRLFLRLLFALLFAWGAFIATVLYLHVALSVIIAVIFAAFWFFIPLVWLHDMALVLALASLGAVFGRFITPWTVMALILLLAIYDFLAVRFRFMLWMVDRLSKVNALPTLIVPKNYSEWSLNLKKRSSSKSHYCSIRITGISLFVCDSSYIFKREANTSSAAYRCLYIDWITGCLVKRQVKWAICTLIFRFSAP